MIVLGVDPGAKETGLVLVRDGGLVGSSVVLRQRCSLPVYLGDVLNAAETRWAGQPLPFGRPDLVAVEDVTTPKYFRGKPLLKPDYLIPLSAVMGAVIAWARGCGMPCVLVPPGHNGQGPLSAYPSELVGARERSGGGILRHCRSAWDVALAGPGLLATTKGAT
jgi:hypothetical protein